MEINTKRGRHKNEVSDEVLKTSVITINDVLEELSNENKRLLNELLFANKCLKSLITFKTFVDFISHKFKDYLNSNECQVFDKLRKKIENNLSQRNRLCEQRLGNYRTERVVNSENERLLTEDIEYKPQIEEEIPNNNSIIDSNLVTNLFKDSLKTYASKILSKISENVVNDNQNSDNSDDNSDDGRHSDGFEDNNSDDFDSVSTQTTTHMNSDHKSTQRSSSRLKQQNKLNSTQIDSKNITKLIKCQIKGCQQIIAERLSEQHFISVHKDSELNCSVDGCNQTFESYDEFTNHLTTHPLNANPTEKTGDIEFFFRTELRDGHQTYVCNFKGCGKEFVKYRGIYQHNINVHKQIQVVLKCQIKGCDYECHSKYDFVIHKKTIHGFDSNEIFSDLTQSMPISIERPLKGNKPEAKIACEWPGCQHLSKSTTAMRFHFSKDHLKCRKRKQFVCNECGVVSMGLDAHKQHISCHKDYYNHKCKWKGCDYKCKKTNQMTDHIQNHTRTEPLVCEICNKAFLVRRNLVSHKRTIHSDNAFICDFEGCGQVFKQKQCLFRHRILVHQKINKQFQCNYENCSLTFKNKYHLNAHKVSHRKPIKSQTFKESLKTNASKILHKISETVVNDNQNNYNSDDNSNNGRHFDDSNDKHSDYIPHKIRPIVCEDEHKTNDMSDPPLKQQIECNSTQIDSKVITKNKSIKCPISGCNKTFVGTLWRQHLISVHKDSDLNCSVDGCNQSFKSYLELTKHLRTHPLYANQTKIHQNTEVVNEFFKTQIRDGHTFYVCKDCGKRFDKYRGVFQHYERLHKYKRAKVSHKRKKKRVCNSITIECDWPGCNHVCHNKKAMRRHYSAEHTNGRKPKKFVCDHNECGVVSMGSVAHKQHISCHKDYYSHRCEWKGCDYKCKKSYQMTDHIQKHTRTEPLVCEICNKEFLVRRNLVSHKKTIHSDNAFICDFEGCGKAFKQKPGLFRHRILVHQNIEKQFKCDYENCSLKFKNIYNLKRHRFNHGEPTIPCVWPGCEYKAKHMIAMRSHEFVHKPEVRRFVCEWPECGKTVRHESTLKDHMRSHYNDKRHVCEWPGCGFRTVTHQSLTKHRRTHRT